MKYFLLVLKDINTIYSGLVLCCVVFYEVLWPVMHVIYDHKRLLVTRSQPLVMWLTRSPAMSPFWMVTRKETKCGQMIKDDWNRDDFDWFKTQNQSRNLSRDAREWFMTSLITANNIDPYDLRANSWSSTKICCLPLLPWTWQTTLFTV